jgi:hypothetical protein
MKILGRARTGRGTNLREDFMPDDRLASKP